MKSSNSLILSNRNPDERWIKVLDPSGLHVLFSPSKYLNPTRLLPKLLLRCVNALNWQNTEGRPNPSPSRLSNKYQCNYWAPENTFHAVCLYTENKVEDSNNSSSSCLCRFSAVQDMVVQVSISRCNWTWSFFWKTFLSRRLLPFSERRFSGYSSSSFKIPMA